MHRHRPQAEQQAEQPAEQRAILPVGERQSKRSLSGRLVLALASGLSAGLISSSPAVVVLPILTLLSGPPARAQSGGPLDAQAVATIARGITVRIEGATQGSGVLVERQGDLYTVLTAWHVVSDQRPGEELAVYTADGREHAVLAGSIQRVGGVDLAVLRFRSPNSYSVAQRAALSSAAMGSTVYVAGFPLPTSAVPKRLLRFLESRVIADAGADIPNGYQLLYDSRTLRGMSGGAVLNSRGQLVAIHGRSETDSSPSEEGDVAVKTGTSQGVPVAFWKQPGGRADTNAPVRQPERETRQEPPAATASTGDAEAYARSANQKYQSGDYQGALADYSQALAIDPRNAKAYSSRSGAKVNLGDYQGALADESQALAIDPRDAIAFTSRGIAKERLGDYQGAIADFSQALAIDPLYALAYHNRGVAKENLGDQNGACEDYAMAIRLGSKITKPCQ